MANKTMTRKEFRQAIEDKLIAAGKKKINKAKLRGTIHRTARFIRNRDEGELVWSRKDVNQAVEFYNDKSTKSID